MVKELQASFEFLGPESALLTFSPSSFRPRSRVQEVIPSTQLNERTREVIPPFKFAVFFFHFIFKLIFDRMA